MSELNTDNCEDLIEILYDLKHDLGKYIRLPVAMLPSDAPLSDVADAIIQGVERTRRGPQGIQSALSLWRAFQGEWGETLSALSSYRRLEETVNGAVKWAERVKGGAMDFTREEALAELTAVSRDISDLLGEVERGCQE